MAIRCGFCREIQNQVYKVALIALSERALCGYSRRKFPLSRDAWLQAGRFAGKDRVRILDSSEIRTYLPQALDQAIAFVQKHLGREAVIAEAHRVDRWTVYSGRDHRASSHRTVCSESVQLTGRDGVNATTDVWGRCGQGGSVDTSLLGAPGSCECKIALWTQLPDFLSCCKVA